MRRTKAKRIIKHAKPSESLEVDYPLVKWAIDCVSSNKFEGDTYATNPSSADSIPVQVEYEILRRDLSAVQSCIQQLQA